MDILQPVWQVLDIVSFVDSKGFIYKLFVQSAQASSSFALLCGNWITQCPISQRVNKLVCRSYFAASMGRTNVDRTVCGVEQSTNAVRRVVLVHLLLP